MLLVYAFFIAANNILARAGTYVVAVSAVPSASGRYGVRPLPPRPYPAKGKFTETSHSQHCHVVGPPDIYIGLLGIKNK